MTIDLHTPAAPALGDQMRYAEALASANLVPDSFKRQPPNVLVALAIAADMGESPWTVMAEMAVVSGRPSFSAKFMRSRVRRAGHRLRESYVDGVARAVIVRSDDPDYEHVAEWDEAKARAHDLWGKGHWKKNPELMLKNRALSEVVREACYEVMGGVGYTPDEVHDFAPDRGQPVQRAAVTQPRSLAEVVAEDEAEAEVFEVERDWAGEISAADSVATLRALWSEAPAHFRDAISARSAEFEAEGGES